MHYYIVSFLVCFIVDCVLGETLTGQMSVCGVLLVLAGMLKHGKRDDLIEFGKLFFMFICIVAVITTVWVNVSTVFSS